LAALRTAGGSSPLRHQKGSPAGSKFREMGSQTSPAFVTMVRDYLITEPKCSFRSLSHTKFLAFKRAGKKTQIPVPVLFL